MVLRKVREIAKGLSAEIWLLHVAEPEPDFVGFDVGPQAERDALSKKFHREHAEIQAIAKQLRSENLETTALLIQGATVETILNEAAKLRTDIIILGSHGRGAMHRLLVGSISEGVLRHAKSPVLIVPTHERTK